MFMQSSALTLARMGSDVWLAAHPSCVAISLK